MSVSGYEVEAGDLRVQAGRDWTDAAELNGVASDLSGVGGPAALMRSAKARRGPTPSSTSTCARRTAARE